ncbi:UNVERIFIED_CONTAM: hypothetical protein BEN50_22390 [Euhalothece sp. KZN 001]
MSRLTLTREPQDLLLKWGANRVAAGGLFPDAEALAVVDGKQVRAVAIYTLFEAHQCMMHFGSDGSRSWGTRNIFGGIFGYAFIFKGLRRIYSPIPARNEDAQSFAVRMGLRFEGRMEQATPDGDDAILMAMVAERCRWIEEEKQDG